MADRNFLPDYGSMPVGGQYRPLFKLFAGENWRMVRKDRQPVTCATAGQAIAAAKDHVQRILNPSIRAEKCDTVADALGVAQSHIERAARSAEAQETLLGAIIGKGGRHVVVERRRVRA